MRAVPKDAELTPMQESEREDELTDWLDDHGVDEGWELAPIFVSAGTTTEFLDKLAAGAPPDMLEGAVRWLSYTLETELLLDEVTDSVTRISIPGGGGEAVLPHGPRAVRAGRHPRRPQEHPGDDGRQARRAQRGEGARPVACRRCRSTAAS